MYFRPLYFTSMRSFFYILLLLCFQTGTSQTFSAWPAQVLDQELAWNEANECYIYFDHPADDTLHLKWRQVEMSLPEGWTADLCDYGLCYTGIPANGTMNPAYDTVRPYLKLIVQPGTLAGSGWLWFRAIDVQQTSNFLDVYFNLHTPGTVGTNTPESSTFQVFPNPATDVLFVKNDYATNAFMQILDVSGTVKWQGSLAAQTTLSLDIAPFPAGVYFLKTGKKTERFFIWK